MNHRVFFLLMFGVVLAATLLLRSQNLSNHKRTPADGILPTRTETASTTDPAPSSGRQSPALPAADPDLEWVIAAKQILRPGADESSCGPYRILTDAAPLQWHEFCAQTVPRIEPAYVSRFGVEPVLPAAGVIILFSHRSAFRTYVADRTGLPSGYAAFTRASRGIVAATVTESQDALARTLTHEIAHLLHRRVFGPDLPPWLSEGLADALGDSATASGIAPLSAPSVKEPILERLLAAVDADEKRPLGELLGLSRSDFDRDVRAADYEQSALLVRFLLLDPALGVRFRGLLLDLTAGKPYGKEGVLDALGVSTETLEAAFERWLRRSASSRST